MDRTVRFVLFIVVTLVLVGCARSYRVSRDTEISESPWPFARGDAESDGYYPGSRFSGKLTLLWEQKEGDKPVGPLTIFNGALVYTGTKKKIRFFNLESGKYLGRIKSRGPAQSGVIALDSMLFFAVGPRKNRLSGFNVFRHKEVWKRPVKDAASGSILVQNRLIVSSGDGSVLAVEPQSGEVIWRFSAKEKFLAAPTYDKGMVVQPGDRGGLYFLSIEDGSLVHRVDLHGPLLSNAVSAEQVYVSDMTGSVYAIDGESGEIVWRAQLDGPLWSSPAVANPQVIVGHGGGEVVSLDARSGDINWRFSTEEVIKASPLIIGNRVVVGTALGTVYCLDASDGRELSRHRLSGAIAYPPITDGERVYIATQRGRVACFGAGDEQTSSTSNGDDFTEGPQ